MNRPRYSESGFTLVELLVGISLFAALSIGFYTMMFSGVDSAQTAESLVRISEEARAGFNRMVRDTREAQEIDPISSTEFNVRTDFNGDGLFTNPNPNGDFEDLNYEISGGELTLNGEVLMTGIRQVGSNPFFTYSSNLLEYDWDDDGITDCVPELDQAGSHGVLGVGDGSGACDSGEKEFLSEVGFALAVEDGDRESTFFAQAQLRNRR